MSPPQCIKTALPLLSLGRILLGSRSQPSQWGPGVQCKTQFREEDFDPTTKSPIKRVYIPSSEQHVQKHRDI